MSLSIDPLLSIPPPTPGYSREVPKEAGWYWCMFYSWSMPSVVYVYQDEGLAMLTAVDVWQDHFALHSASFWGPRVYPPGQEPSKS